MDLVQGLLEVAHAGLAGVAVGYAQQGILGVLHLVLRETSPLEAPRNEVAPGDLELLAVDVAGEPDDLHPVDEGEGYRVHRVRRADEEDVRGVEGKVEIVIPEGHVLLGVEDLEQGARGIALEARAHLVDLVDHEHRVLGLYDLEALDDLSGHRADVGPPVALDLGLVPHAADRKAEELLSEGLGDGLADARLADSGRPHEADDGAAVVLLQLPHGEVLDDPVLHVVQPVVVGVQDGLRGLEVEALLGRRLPGKGADGVEVIPGDDELARIRVHQIEFLEFLLDDFLDLAFELEGLYLFLEPLVVAALRVDGNAELGLDRLELFPEEVIALALLDLLVDLVLYPLLDPEKLLFLFDEDEHGLHPVADVRDLQDPLLVDLVDVQDGGDEVGDLPRMIDVDHVESHLFREEGVVLGQRLHLREEGSGEGLHLVGVVGLVIHVLDGGYDGILVVEEFLDAETLQRGDEDVDSAVGEVDLLDDLGRRADLVKVGARRLVVVLFFQEKTDDAVSLKDGVDGLDIILVAHHNRGENAGENGTTRQGNDRELVRENLIQGDDFAFCHAYLAVVNLP